MTRRILALLAGLMLAGNAHALKVMYAEVTLSLDTSAYADGDVLADTQDLSLQPSQQDRNYVLHSAVVLDKDDQGVALDLVFLRENKTLGTENAAVSISDADAAEIVGVVEVVAGDYVDLTGSQVAQRSALSIVVSPSSATSLFMGVISRGAGTYTASGIVVKVGFLLED